MRIELVLGSGAAHGLAHIGVLRAIEERTDLEICAIRGTSIGALVGAAWAAGRLDRLEAEMLALTPVRGLMRYADPAWSGRALIGGRRVGALLRRVLGDAEFADLTVPVSVMAVDLDTWDLVHLERGPVRRAVRASIGIPGIFSPTTIEGRRLVDGTLVSTLPIPETRHADADATLAVDVIGHPDQADGPARPVSWRGRLLPRTLLRTFDIMQHSIAGQARSAHPDALVLDIIDASPHSLAFYRAAPIIAHGYRKARDFLRRRIPLDAEAPRISRR